MSQDAFDLVVVGGGPGGYVAAIRARQLGMATALIEREHLGGICLNWGCIPTKALLHASGIYHQLGSIGEFGISVGEVSFDLPKLVQRSRRVAKRLSAGVKHLLRKNEVTVIDGHARLAGPGVVHVAAEGQAERAVRAPHIVLATGARARSVPGLEPDGERIWSYREAMLPESMPKSLLVVGSGAIGVEFASFYRDMGAEVSLVEILPRILPVEDEEIAAFARKAFERQGMHIRTGATVGALTRTESGVSAEIADEAGERQVLEVERVIVAVGVTGNVEDLGLETTAARVEQGRVLVDEWCRTDQVGLYAIGDLVGGPQLAHKASHEGVLCIEHILGRAGAHPLDPTLIPACTYCRPQVASVGLTERAAREAGYELRIGRFPFQGNGKAVAIGDTEGMAKTIFDARTGELLGAHLIGPEVTEMIQGYVIARSLESTEAELVRAIFPHPTVSEVMHESVLAAYGQAIHI
jgi:dihydrolipoyl dehydrogenase